MPPRSKIAQLPDEIRAWLHKALVERGYGDIVALTEELNALCKEGGVGISIGKSAVGAESQRVRRAQEAIRAATDAARLIADSSNDQADSRSEATMAIVQAETFEMLLQVQEARSTDDPAGRLKLLASIGKSVATLSRARVNQAKWRDELDARAKAAAERVAKLAKKGGASADTIREIKEHILGITKRGPGAATA